MSFFHPFVDYDAIDLNQYVCSCVDRSPKCLFGVVKRHFLRKSDGIFKYKDVLFELWNYGSGWNGQIINDPVGRHLIMRGKNRWIYRDLDAMFYDLTTSIDSTLYERTKRLDNC